MRYMTDFWRLANALVVVVIVFLALFWGLKRKQRPTAPPEKAARIDAERLAALRARKQKLAADLEDYDAEIVKLETESRELVEAVLNAQEAEVTKLVREEAKVLLDEMQAKAKAGLADDAAAVKADFAKRLNGQDS